MGLFQRILGPHWPSSPRDELLSRLPRGKAGAEIGVWRGDFSAKILAVAKPSVLHLVDPWDFSPQYPKRWYGGLIAKSQHDMDATFDGVVNRFKGDLRVRIHRDRSADFYARFTEPLDWVYIDGDHSLEAVLYDLRSAWRCVNPEGICNPLVFPDHLEVEGYRDFAIKYARGATSPSDSCGRISL
jgi:hypothetical protein